MLDSSPPIGRLNGRSAVITGAGSGIGRATAEHFVREGATVLVTDRDPAAAARVAQAIDPTGARARAQRLDVTNEADWAAATAALIARWGRLDVLVANAGVSMAKPTVEMSLDDWRQVMAVNLDGVFLGVKHAIGAMVRGGSIVIVSSTSGQKAAPGASAYAASKAGVRLLAKSVALEYADRGIRVNTVLPAGVVTPMWQGAPFWAGLVAEQGSEEAAWRALAANTPLKRFAQPAEIARTILFLASDEASYITGAELFVDGGYTA